MDRALFCSHFAKSPGQSPSQSPGQSPSQVSRSVSKSVSRSVSESPSQSFSFVQLVFWISLIHIQLVGLTIFYLPSSWLMFYCCLIVVVFMVWSCRKIWRRWCFISISHVRLNDYISTGASFVVATSCFKYMVITLFSSFFHLMIDVLNLKLCFATDVLTERSGSLSEPGPIFSILIWTS